MTIVDTNVILDFIKSESQSKAVVSRQCTALGNQTFYITTPVLVEVFNLLPRFGPIEKFVRLQELLPLSFLPTEDLVNFDDVLRWMVKYTEHDPDFADAHLVLLAASNTKIKIWTNDTEFKTTWRMPNGKRVKLAV